LLRNKGKTSSKEYKIDWKNGEYRPEKDDVVDSRSRGCLGSKKVKDHREPHILD
jgi:hypothetical protein